MSMLCGRPTSTTIPSIAKALIETRSFTEHARNGYGTYLISLLGNNIPVGTVSLMRGEKSSLLAPDVGCAFFSEHTGKGYAVEAAEALIEDVKRERVLKLDLDFVMGRMRFSMGALRKLGLEGEGSRKVEEFGDRGTEVWSWE